MMLNIFFKRATCFSLAVVVAITMAMPVFANESLKIVINDKEAQFEQAPVMVENRVFVPMRAIFENLGAAIYWEASTQTVFAVKSGTSINLKVGASNASINDQTVEMEQSARLIDGHTYVPLRFVSEALAAKVTWDGQTQTVLIETGEQASILSSSSETDEADLQLATVQQVEQNGSITVMMEGVSQTVELAGIELSYEHRDPIELLKSYLPEGLTIALEFTGDMPSETGALPVKLWTQEDGRGFKHLLNSALVYADAAVEQDSR